MTGRYTENVLKPALRFGGAALLALAFVSCSGVPSSPEGAAKKMLRAYGGEKKAARLRNFAAKGFIKDLSSETVAKSYAFDVYRKGSLYKHKVMAAPVGKLTDVIVMYFDGTTSREWLQGKGIHTIPSMELGLLKYRFPDCIQWAQTAGKTGKMVPVKKGDSVVRIRYTDGSEVITIALDRKSWFLSGVEITNTSDTAAVYTESYDHYTDIADIPFPQEFKATFRGAPYYEYLLSVVDLDADLPDTLFRVTNEDTIELFGPAQEATQAAPKK
ncbi:MAG: hypothetical protein NTW97_12395 [Candidatus Krumholzibacteria bacterium]|nr:hypothetical protein [Candidatus Krumholzibacteria bacterium]